tara:strand:+ start:19286 stop:19513 length:228 start_codon:yes stop_codon:yes gene_type:complete
MEAPKLSTMYTISYGSFGGEIHSRTVMEEKDIHSECLLIDEKFSPDFIQVSEVTVESWFYKDEGGVNKENNPTIQ